MEQFSCRTKLICGEGALEQLGKLQIGSLLLVTDPFFAQNGTAERVAKAAGAEMIVTACPLCKYNLEKNGTEVPVVYFTELLAEALGVKE